MQTVTPFWDALVSDGTDEVEAEAVTAAFGTVEVAARGRPAGAACPGCGCFSGRFHDRYQRTLRDLPLVDQGFVVRLTVRRFVCGSTDCPRRTFTEPFAGLTAPHARFTMRLNRALERIGLALEGSIPRPRKAEDVSSRPTRSSPQATGAGRVGSAEEYARASIPTDAGSRASESAIVDRLTFNGTNSYRLTTTRARAEQKSSDSLPRRRPVGSSLGRGQLLRGEPHLVHRDGHPAPAVTPATASRPATPVNAAARRMRLLKTRSPRNRRCISRPGQQQGSWPAQTYGVRGEVMVRSQTWAGGGAP
ncbi:transposase family protein [Streptomyces sp. NPDC007818]|uniref:transposase family protein n=1 Tax=Streptomyces sp. NPDC007818 TaxID=3364780 RepID=UPI0036AEAF0E